MADQNYDPAIPAEVHDTVADDAPDTLATPEGDNEFLPEEPLDPNAPDITRPRGNEPHPSQPIRPAQP